MFFGQPERNISLNAVLNYIFYIIEGNPDGLLRFCTLGDLDKRRLIPVVLKCVDQTPNFGFP